MQADAVDEAANAKNGLTWNNGLIGTETARPIAIQNSLAKDPRRNHLSNSDRRTDAWFVSEKTDEASVLHNLSNFFLREPL